jgi:predicted nuclease with TOPRIM domain
LVAFALDVLSYYVYTSGAHHTTRKESTMTSENQALLDAIRGIVGEAITPLADRIERVEVEQREQRRLLESSVERLELRTTQISRELYELQERVERGFSSLKRESELSLRQVSKLENGQKSNKKRFKELEAQVALLEQRVEKLEDQRNAE